MKKIYLLLTAAIVGVVLFAGVNRSTSITDGFITGTPEIKSATALTFGPQGILFIGDSKSAAVFALDTKDTKKAKAQAFEVKNLDEKVAAALGTTKDNISITDMVVNPVSKKLYLAIQLADGTPALLKMESSNIQAVPLTNVSYSSVTLNDAPAADAKDQRGRSMRVTSISDIGYTDGKLLVSGISNKEFASSFRSIPFPFTNAQETATLEMYHASHGRYETTSPIRTFTTGAVNGKQYLIASYTCTPLVLFPLDELKAGMHVKGRTIAEMGNMNTPVDMIKLNEGGIDYLVLANDRRPVAKMPYSGVEAFQGTLTEKVAATAGVDFSKLPLEKVVQLDKLDDNRAVILQKKADGALDLWTSDGKNL